MLTRGTSEKSISFLSLWWEGFFDPRLPSTAATSNVFLLVPNSSNGLLQVFILAQVAAGKRPIARSFSIVPDTSLWSLNPVLISLNNALHIFILAFISLISKKAPFFAVVVTVLECVPSVLNASHFSISPRVAPQHHGIELDRMLLQLLVSLEYFLACES